MVRGGRGGIMPRLSRARSVDVHTVPAARDYCISGAMPSESGLAITLGVPSVTIQPERSAFLHAMNQATKDGKGSMDGAALAGVLISVFVAVVTMALPFAFPDFPRDRYRLLFWIALYGIVIVAAYLAAAKLAPQKTGSVTVMALGFVIFSGGMLWFRSTPADTTDSPAAPVQAATDQNQPAPDNTVPCYAVPSRKNQSPSIEWA